MLVEQILKEISEAKSKGAITAGLNIFDGLDEYKPSSTLSGQVEYTFEIYDEYVKRVVGLGEDFQNKYLNALKNSDIVDNQSIEKEDSLLIRIYRTFNDKDSALDLLIRNYGKSLTVDNFTFIHDILLDGTSSEDKKGLRIDDMKYVGRIDEFGERHIEYFPILQEEIGMAVEKFITYYNSHINVDDIYDATYQPIIYNGLIAALQLFNDGNSRYGRLFQNIEYWGKVNQLLDVKIKKPLVYISRQCYPYRGEARELIKDIVVCNSKESWDNWIKFNLKRIQDNIYKSEYNINVLSRKLR